MPNFPTPVQNALDAQRPFRAIDYIREGWEICKQNIGLFIGYLFVMGLISAVAAFIPFASLLISGALVAGFYIVAHKIRNNESYDFNNFFDGFQSWQQLALLHIMQVVIVLLLLLPLGACFFLERAMLINSLHDAAVVDGMPDGADIGGGAMPIVFILFAFLSAIALALFGIAVYFAPLFVVFHGMPAWDAMKASYALARANFGQLLLFFLLIGVIMFVAVLPCYLGMLVAIPTVMCAQYAAFADLMDLNIAPDDANDDITQHFISA